MSAERVGAERIRGLYGIADGSSGDPVRLGALMLEGGCRLVQLRCKGWAPEDVLVAARELRLRTHLYDAVLIVNDDPEVAVAADADGVHLGATDLDVEAARRIVGDRLIGRSTNDPAQIREALRGADYVAFGPVWETKNVSRPKAVRGVEWLAVARRLVPEGVPLVAIGGITAERLDEVRAAGADAWAVIGAIAGAPDPVAATRDLLGPPPSRTPRIP